jgi:SAM-dependent methyltransferase
MASDTYRLLARYYDHLFEEGPAFARARRTVLGPVWRQVQSACDLCCGTGTFAVEIAQRGIEMFALDLSPDMIAATRKKARAAGVKVTAAVADMRAFRLPHPVDLITCEYDAVNHVPQRRDLARVCRSAARALNPGGYFAFDVNNRDAFLTIWANTWFIEKDPVALVMRGSYEYPAMRAMVDVEWFVRQGKLWKRYHEHIEEVCWTADEIRRALEEAGFDDIQEWDAAPFFRSPFTLPGNRTFWRARRRG